MTCVRRLAVLGAFLGVACASTEVPDVTPEVDPALPEVEAGEDPSRAEGGGDDAGAAPQGTGGDAGKAKPKPPPPADAGADDASTFFPIDSGPPPPPKPAQGEVLITEVMYDPFGGAEPDGEWFELHSMVSTPRSLGGLVLSDGGGRTHTIAAGTTIEGGAYVVFARKKSAANKVPASVLAYEYGESLPSNAGVQLANGATGALYLRSGGAVIAQAAYGGWFSQSGGSSVQLDVLDFTASADKSSWCLSYATWTSGSDKGTPGAPSDCP